MRWHKNNQHLIGVIFLLLINSIIMPTYAQTYVAGDIIDDEFGVEMVFVPGGTFTLGIEIERLHSLCEQHSEPNPDRCVEIIQADTGATYLQTVDIPPFWIDRFEVTIELFEQLCGLNANTQLDDCIASPRDTELTLNPSQPQVGVSWYTANFSCNQRNARLPTEAEWEYAASGHDRSIFAWGDTFNPDYVQHSDPQYSRTYPVGTISENQSWVGAFDMTGNVAEWVEDRYSARILATIEPEDWPTAMPINTLEFSRMTKGGFWNSPVWNLMNSSHQQQTSPEVSSPNIGFRCVRSLLGA